MFKIQDALSESALCVGIVAALIWGIGLGFYGFNQPERDLSLTLWWSQLLGGIVACLIVPLVCVHGGRWVMARGQEDRKSSGRAHASSSTSPSLT